MPEQMGGFPLDFLKQVVSVQVYTIIVHVYAFTLYCTFNCVLICMEIIRIHVMTLYIVPSVHV